MTRFQNGRGGRPSTKALQLCAQAAEALVFALADAADPVLQDLIVDRVEPMPDERHLLVTLKDPCGHGLAPCLQAVDHARGHLRAAVAAFAVRRKAPQLSFTVEPDGAR